MAPTSQTTIVPPTSVQKPWMLNPPTITSVSHRMNIATKNHAMPSVSTASGRVRSFQDRLDEGREDPVDERSENQRPGRSADRDPGEDPGRDRERGGVDGPRDEDAEQERHGGDPIRPFPLRRTSYDIGAGAAFGAATSDLAARKSATEATATQSSQNSIVKKMTEAIAATPATKPNQLTQRGRIA